MKFLLKPFTGEAPLWLAFWFIFAIPNFYLSILLVTSPLVAWFNVAKAKSSNSFIFMLLFISFFVSLHTVTLCRENTGWVMWGYLAIILVILNFILDIMIFGFINFLF